MQGQVLTIRADGRVALTTYENKGVDYSAMDSRNYDYPMADVERIIKDISAFFEETHDIDLVEGAGQWEIVITDTDNVRFKENGSLGHGSDMTGLSSISNNLSENAIRPFTVGRKNWLFSDTTKGAEASSICYTMVEMAKAHGLNPFLYMNFLLVNRPGENPSDNDLAILAPWSDLAQEQCKS